MVLNIVLRKEGETMSILIYDDNEENLKIMEYSLNSVGYDVKISSNIIESIKIVENNSNIDLLITKFDISYFSLKDYLYILRRLNKDIRIVVLSNSNDYEDEVESINLCVDEYIKKPVSTIVLQKRIERILHHKNTANIYFIKGDFITIDANTNIIKKFDKVVNLSMKEYKILILLAQKINSVVSRKEIYEAVWGTDYNCKKARVIDVHISNIKSKLSMAKLYSVRGIGYKLDN